MQEWENERKLLSDWATSFMSNFKWLLNMICLERIKEIFFVEYFISTRAKQPPYLIDELKIPFWTFALKTHLKLRM